MKILFKNRATWVVATVIFLVLAGLLHSVTDWSLWWSIGLAAVLAVGVVALTGWLCTNYLAGEPAGDSLSHRLDVIDKKLDEIRRGPVTHQIIINSISDLSNDELRKVLAVQKDLNAG